MVVEEMEGEMAVEEMVAEMEEVGTVVEKEAEMEEAGTVVEKEAEEKSVERAAANCDSRTIRSLQHYCIGTDYKLLDCYYGPIFPTLIGVPILKPCLGQYSCTHNSDKRTRM